MKIDVLVSCMNQGDDLIAKSRITGDAVVVNQCARAGERSIPTARGNVRWVDSPERGLTRSRNLAVTLSVADVCLLCDDDERFLPDYRDTIRGAYERLPVADVIIFKMAGMPTKLPNRVCRLRFPRTLHVASWQISFRRKRLLRSGVRFDEQLGAGTGNGAEEELKFLTDCARAGLKIFYVPEEIASVHHEASTWFRGFDEEFFYNRGATTRYILGYPTAMAYTLYYVLAKRPVYRSGITCRRALGAILRGIHENRITKQARRMKNENTVCDHSRLQQ